MIYIRATSFASLLVDCRLMAVPDARRAYVFRIRVGVYHIIYSVSGRKLVIIILKIGHRRDIYR